jgi:hypothetical protein
LCREDQLLFSFLKVMFFQSYTLFTFDLFDQGTEWAISLIRNAQETSRLTLENKTVLTGS